jgi:hypothetical protein
MDAYGALPPGPPLSSGGGHKWQMSATTRDTATTPVNASMVIEFKRFDPATVPAASLWPGVQQRSYGILVASVRRDQVPYPSVNSGHGSSPALL